MAAHGHRLIQRDQPPQGAVLSEAIPRPWVCLRAMGRNHVTTGLNPVSSSNYVGHSPASTTHGRGIRIDGISGSGISHTFADFPERQRYAVAVLFRVDSISSNRTIFGINGSDNGIQVRINTSAQIELLAEASALLATSTDASFTAGTTHCLVAIADGSTYIYADGKHILTYAGVVDNKLSVKFLTLGCRGAGTSEVMDGTIIESTMWSGTLPSRTLGMEISRDYYGTMFLRRRSAKSSTSVSTVPVGRSNETDSAFALTAVQVRATSRADEADSASALSAVQLRATGRADETDAAFALAHLQTLTTGRADETDTAYALSLGGTAVPVGRADETDAAYALTQLQLISTGRADETDTAYAPAAVQARATGRADETDVAYALSLGAEGTVGLATESDGAFALTAVQIRATGLATETDIAYALSTTASGAVGLATETDTAYALAAVQRSAVGRADEADTAYALSPLLLLTAGLSLEIDTAFARPALQARLVGRADELDQAAVPGGTFGLAHVISPRLWAVPSEHRYYVVPSEDRTYVVPSEDRGTAP